MERQQEYELRKKIADAIQNDVDRVFSEKLQLFNHDFYYEILFPLIVLEMNYKMKSEESLAAGLGDSNEYLILVNPLREGDVDTLYLFVDKRIQYHDNGTNRHVIPIFMLAYLFENNSSKRQLILSDVFSEIREMKSRVRYERIKLKEPVHLGEITVI